MRCLTSVHTDESYVAVPAVSYPRSLKIVLTQLSDYRTVFSATGFAHLFFRFNWHNAFQPVHAEASELRFLETIEKLVVGRK